MPERTITVTTKYYTFDQNNSGGRFHVNHNTGITHYVIIEAANAKAANSRAEDIGIYFNGCENNQDCSCCGDRWQRTTEQDGTESPEIFGQPAEKYKSDIELFSSDTAISYGKQDIDKEKKALKSVAIHYLSGEIKWI